MFPSALLFALLFQSGSPSATQAGSKIPAVLPCGYWEPSFQHDLTGFPPILPRFNAAHMVLIPKGQHRGKVMVWDILADQTTPEWLQRWSIVDPVAPGGPVCLNYLLAMPAGGGDLFCAGFSWTSEGDLLVVGGTSQYPATSAMAGSPTDPRRLHPSGPGAYIGGRLTYLWDPADTFYGADGWHRQADMAIDRWYPTAVLRGDGSLIVAGGVTSTEEPIQEGNNYEVFIPTGTNPPTGVWQQPQLFPGPENWNSTLYIYPRMYALTTGELFLAGMPSHSAKLDHTNAPGVWVRGKKSSYDIRVYETTVLMPYIPDVLGNYQDEVLILGGIGLDYLETGGWSASTTTTGTARGRSLRDFSTHGTVDTVQVCAPTASDQSWSSAPSMMHARKYANGILLPDGSLFVVGGNFGGGVGGGVVLNPELYDGANWTELPPLDSPRTYHSTAVLLPDGRVLSAGGNTATSDYQVFVPSYLCGGDPRPVITAAPASMGYFAENPLIHSIGFEAMPPGHSVERAVLISPGAVTHHTDCNQRYVQLILDSSSADQLEVRAPANRNLVPPGYYMLFLVSAAGVPSEAAWVKVQ